MGKIQFSSEKKGARVKKSKSRGRELERQAQLFGSKKEENGTIWYRIYSQSTDYLRTRGLTRCGRFNSQRR